MVDRLFSGVDVTNQYGQGSTDTIAGNEGDDVLTGLASEFLFNH